MKKKTKEKIEKRVKIYLEKKLGRRYLRYNEDKDLDLIKIYKRIKKKDSDFPCHCFHCIGEYDGYKREPKTKNVWQITEEDENEN